MNCNYQSLGIATLLQHVLLARRNNFFFFFFSLVLNNQIHCGSTDHLISMFEFTNKIKIFAFLPKKLPLKWKISSCAGGKDWNHPTYHTPDHLLLSSLAEWT